MTTVFVLSKYCVKSFEVDISLFCVCLKISHVDILSFIFCHLVSPRFESEFLLLKHNLFDKCLL